VYWKKCSKEEVAQQLQEYEDVDEERSERETGAKTRKSLVVMGGCN